MTADPLDECFAAFTSAVRVETLPAYSVPSEAARIRAWLAGQPRPERSVRTDEYLREVAQDVINGKTRARVRVVGHPLSDYERYQILGGSYTETQAAGEEIRIATPVTAEIPARVALIGDFWLFDHGTDDVRAVLMDYSPAGAYLGSHLADPTRLRACCAAWDTLYRLAVPLNTYLAGRHTAAA